MTLMYQDHFMRHAITLARRALTEPGTEPFGAVIVKDDVIVGEGLNRSLAHFDPTSHGEVEAIRDACQKLRSVDLTGCDLYTSCEPCALCVAAMKIAGIRTLYYATSLDQAGKVLDGLDPRRRHPIDVDAVRRAAGATLAAGEMPSSQAMPEEATEVLIEWVSRPWTSPDPAVR
ncbi:hypothetical protein N825_33330 [Skermanella stibiiresistens SB22]|uniref:CMP/dCMP-type deaminase domain-containing protein n=1 Tax=Skermanella stibiiresistens SB22 TaxID=1385369 RepID=W9H442_9PROT|nr:nucleoside deaminase [Skermanella stibiiresistens]EWY40814.1 hypothetical protein N825_33330 [Skermanella stibiiresistens SB22]